MHGAEFMILGKLALTFGVLLGIAVWELRGLKRERTRRRDASAAVLTERSERGDVRR